MDGNDRAITALTMLAHGVVHTYEMTIPLFVVIWLSEFDVISLGFAAFEVTTASIGVIVTIGYGLFGLGALPGGVLVDRFGSRRLITGCLLGMGAAYLLLGLASSMLVIALALVIWGAAASVYHPAGLSLISKGVSERGTGFAYHGIAGNLGIGIGPLVAAVLLLFVEWRTVALVLALPALAATVYASKASFNEHTPGTDEPTTDGGSVADSGVDSFAEFVTESKQLFAGGFLLVFVVVMSSGLYYRGVLTFLPEILRGMPGVDPILLSTLVPGFLHETVRIDPGARTVNPQDYIYSGLLIIGVLGQYAGGKLTDRIRVEHGLFVAFGVLAILALAFVPISTIGLVPLLTIGALLGAFLFAVQPMYQAAVAEYTPAGSRGLSYGYTYVGVFGVGALGGGIAGVVLTYANLTTLFVTLATFAVVASLVSLYLGRE